MAPLSSLSRRLSLRSSKTKSTSTSTSTSIMRRSSSMPPTPAKKNKLKTQSFKVRANLTVVVNHQSTSPLTDDDDDNLSSAAKELDLQDEQDQSKDDVKLHGTQKPRLNSAASTESASSFSSTSHHIITDHVHTPPLPTPSTTTTTTTTTTPYYRGGGYSVQLTKSYDERWRPDQVDLVVRSWKMTDVQRTKLLTFRDRVSDVDHFLNDPHQLVYFLKDELGNVDLAEKLWRKVVAARQISPYDMDTILTSYTLPDDYDYFPMVVLKGVDREGDPIHITRTGVADCWGLYKRHGRDAMIRHAIFYQELDVRGVWRDDYQAVHHKMPTQFTVIFDLQGLSSRHMRPGLLPACGVVARLLQDTYPELVKRVLIIRAPSIFKMIWGLVKHFFDAELRDLMIFATSDEDSHHVMEQYVDPNVLPHCIHPGGIDGPVARGYEHVILEGGLLPPEGTYQTPEHIKALQRQQHIQQTAATAAAANQQQTTVTQKPTPVVKRLLSGSFDIVPHDADESVSSNSMIAQEGKALIRIN